MPNLKRIKRIPFQFFYDHVKSVLGNPFHFGSVTVTGWAKRKGRKWIADVDKVFNQNDNIKDKFECEDGMEQIDAAADQHVKELLNQLQIH